MNSFLDNLTEGTPARDLDFIKQQAAEEELRKQQQETEQTEAGFTRTTTTPISTSRG